MIRYKIREQIAEKEFREARRVKLADVAEETGIHRMTLSKIINRRGYSTTTAVLDKLCAYFDCRIEDLIQYVPDSEVPGAGAAKEEEK